MNAIVVNGTPREDLNVPQNWRLDQLIQFLYQRLNSAENLVTSVQVDGVELTSANENALSSVPVVAVGDVEVKTAHPREIAEEMLQNLRVFFVVLREKAAALAHVEKDHELQGHLVAFFDGLKTVAEAIRMIKKAMNLPDLPESAVLEKEFSLILNTVLTAQGKQDYPEIRMILNQRLAENLKAWSEKGIPELIRARDC